MRQKAAVSVSIFLWVKIFVRQYRLLKSENELINQLEIILTVSPHLTSQTLQNSNFNKTLYILERENNVGYINAVIFTP